MLIPALAYFSKAQGPLTTAIALPEVKSLSIMASPFFSKISCGMQFLAYYVSSAKPFIAPSESKPISLTFIDPSGFLPKTYPPLPLIKP